MVVVDLDQEIWLGIKWGFHSSPHPSLSSPPPGPAYTLPCVKEIPFDSFVAFKLLGGYQGVFGFECQAQSALSLTLSPAFGSCGNDSLCVGCSVNVVALVLEPDLDRFLAAGSGRKLPGKGFPRAMRTRSQAVSQAITAMRREHDTSLRAERRDATDATDASGGKGSERETRSTDSVVASMWAIP